MSYLNKWFNNKKTAQSAPIPGTSQVANSAGGFAFAVDDWARLDRFLILGSEGGSYYATERKLTRANAQAVHNCLQVDGRRVVNRIVEISDQGRAPKNDPALFALAMAAKLGDLETRQAAFAALPRVARIGTHLFHFAEYVKALGGWGRGTTRAFGRWYTEMEAGRLAFQAIKYQSRDGWSHRDLLRKAHPKAKDERQQALFHWMTKGWESVGETAHPDEVLATVWAFERAKSLREKKDAPLLVELIRQHRLPHECVPTEMKQHPEIWEALLPDMGLTAILRNLGKMTEVGLLGAFSDAERLVVSRLERAEALRAARVHPLQIRYADFHTLTRARTLFPTCSELELYPVVKEMLAAARTRPLPLRLLGIQLSNLGVFEQLSLFDQHEKVGAVVDRLREKYGFSIVGLATQLGGAKRTLVDRATATAPAPPAAAGAADPASPRPRASRWPPSRPPRG